MSSSLLSLNLLSKSPTVRGCLSWLREQAISVYTLLFKSIEIYKLFITKFVTVANVSTSLTGPPRHRRLLLFYLNVHERVIAIIVKNDISINLSAIGAKTETSRVFVIDFLVVVAWVYCDRPAFLGRLTLFNWWQVALIICYWLLLAIWVLIHWSQNIFVIIHQASG